MSAINVIGFDADDTLWENEAQYKLTEARFTALLQDYADPSHLSARLLAAERRNLGHYGYGIKGFTLSMIETALEVTEGRAPAAVIQSILDAGRDLHNHPTPLLPNVQATLEALSHPLILITKGDLFDQERKIAQSGLAEFFAGIQIVSEKTAETYQRAFAPYGAAMMVGNSLKSDILPALEAGAWAVHIPAVQEWALEAAAPPDSPRFRRLDNMAQLPKLLAELEGKL